MNSSLILTTIVLLIVFVNLVLGIFTYARNNKNKVNLTFFFFAVATSLWIMANYFEAIVDNHLVATFLVQTDFALGVLLANIFLVLSSVLGKPYSRLRFLVFSSVPVSILLAVLVYAGQVVGVTFVEAGISTVDKMFLPLYIVVTLGYLISGIIVLVVKRRRSRGLERSQLSTMLLGLTITVLFVAITNLILPLFVSSINFLTNAQRLSYSAVLFFNGLTTYAIIRHRLFDIRAVVARSVAYIFSIGVFIVIYSFLAFGLTQGVLLQGLLLSQRSQQIFNVALAVMLALTFPTFRRFFERITDRIFYRDKYDPQILISDIGRILASEIDLEQLTKKVLDTLMGRMRIVNSNIVVMDGEKIYYQVHKDKIHQLYHPQDLKFIKNTVTITDELQKGERRDLLERHGIRASMSLKTKESFVGYLLVGEKRSGDIYTSEDIQTFQIIADELAVAIQNARSYQEIQTFNATLREKIRQATKDLTHANRELKELDKAKDEFISMASHQLRTPLTAVRGYTSMVMDGDFGKVSVEQHDTLKQSFDAATRMGRLVDDLLNVSRIQSGKFTIERMDTDLNAVLPEEMSLLETTANTKKVHIEYHPPKQPVPILKIDEGKTRQALMNLMDNSIYYSSTVAGGGKVDVYLENDATHVIFRVVDNGIGVPKDQQAKLFKKFYRAPNAQKTRPDGTGLGLFLVGKVVQGQGGEIIFTSQEGKGSTFGFKLPIVPTGDGLSKLVGVEEKKAV